MPTWVVGIGASGANARDLVDAGIAAIAVTPLFSLRAQSRRYQNPAWGGATRAPFVNAAVVVDSALGPAQVLSVLFSIERVHGRLRTQKNAARTLDLDILWSSLVGRGATSASSQAGHPTLPHPRFLQRAFAVIPAVEAMTLASVPLPLSLQQAAKTHALAPLVALP